MRNQGGQLRPQDTTTPDQPATEPPGRRHRSAGDDDLDLAGADLPPAATRPRPTTARDDDGAGHAPDRRADVLTPTHLVAAARKDPPVRGAYAVRSGRAAFSEASRRGTSTVAMAQTWSGSTR